MSKAARSRIMMTNLDSLYEVIYLNLIVPNIQKKKKESRRPIPIANSNSMLSSWHQMVILKLILLTPIYLHLVFSTVILLYYIIQRDILFGPSMYRHSIWIWVWMSIKVHVYQD